MSTAPSHPSRTTYEPPPGGFRTFLILWASQSVSALGSTLTGFAVSVWLAQVRFPGSDQQVELAAALSAVGLAYTIPWAATAPLVGLWVDRHDYKTSLLVSNLTSGSLVAVLAALLASGTLDVWMLVLLAIGLTVSGSMQMAAFLACYPRLVPIAHLPRAHGMSQAAFSVAGIMGPAIAAALITIPRLASEGRQTGAEGVALACGLDAISFFLVALIIPFLAIPSPQRQPSATIPRWSPRILRTDLLEGLRFIWKRKPLLWLLATYTAFNFADGSFPVITPLLVRFSLAGDSAAHGLSFESTLAALVSAGAAGGLLGGVLISAWGGLRTRRAYGVVVPLLLLGIVQVTYGLSPWVALTTALAFAHGLVLPIANAHSHAIWSTHTPAELMGRVFAGRVVIGQGAAPLGTAAAGWAGGLAAPGTVLVVFGALLALVCTGQLFNRQLRLVDEHEPSQHTIPR